VSRWPCFCTNRVTLAGLRDTESEKVINNQRLEWQIFCHPTRAVVG
jgi:hypothetical protein